MLRRLLTVTALAIGLGAAAVLVWLWRQTPPPSGPLASAEAPPRSADTAAPASASPAAGREPHPWLALLQRAVARGEARSREAVLTFKDDAALARFLTRARAAGLTVLAQADRLRTVRVRYDNFAGLDAELRAHAGDYAAVGANTLLGIPQPPPKENRTVGEQIPFGNDTLAYLGAAGDRSTWGRGLTLAILDTGVAADATFGSGRLRTLDIGLGSAPGAGNGDGHGTGVAALAAGASPDAAGLAPAAQVLSIRVTDADGLSDLFTVAQAIVAAVDAGAKIVNISLGGYATGAVLDAAIGYASERGAIIVAAAGNDQAAQLAWPAADPRVISVGAIDGAEQQVAFSNSGAGLDFTAPGYGVQTAWLDGQRATVNGTSASAPIVAGALAAVLSQNPNLTSAQAVDLLARTASDGGAPGADPAYGQGILNVGWALNAGNPAYVDTAVSSHYYNAAAGTVSVVVQNRSGSTVTGLNLTVGVGAVSSTQPVPGLAPGESYTATVPVGAALPAGGALVVTTDLVNPLGTADRVPANNRRTSVLSPAPDPP